MKAALLCFVLLLSLLGGSLLYSVKMAHTAEEFREQATVLSHLESEKRTDKINQLAEEWESKEIWFSLSVPHSELDRIESELVHTKTAAQTKDDSEFQLAVALLADAFEHIGKLYEASLDNIL